MTTSTSLLDILIIYAIQILLHNINIDININISINIKIILDIAVISFSYNFFYRTNLLYNKTLNISILLH